MPLATGPQAVVCAPSRAACAVAPAAVAQFVRPWNSTHTRHRTLARAVVITKNRAAMASTAARAYSVERFVSASRAGLLAPGLVELLLLRRALHGRDRRRSAGGDLGDLVEVAHAHELLVPHRRVAVLLGGELAVLEVGVRGHPARFVIPGQREHAVVQRVERGQRDELELVVQGAELALERGDLGVAQVLAPVERRRAVV